MDVHCRCFFVYFKAKGATTRTTRGPTTTLPHAGSKTRAKVKFIAHDSSSATVALYCRSAGIATLRARMNSFIHSCVTLRGGGSARSSIHTRHFTASNRINRAMEHSASPKCHPHSDDYLTPSSRHPSSRHPAGADGVPAPLRPKHVHERAKGVGEVRRIGA